MPYIFDGKKFAEEKEKGLKKRVAELKKRGIIPKLASIIVGDDPGSILYQNLKRKAAERVGAELTVISLSSSASLSEIRGKLNTLNEDSKVHGIMVQLPLPGNFSDNDKYEIINTITPEKDVDGLRQDSPFLHPTSKAVLEVLDCALDIVRPPCREKTCKVCIVGATGMVGTPITKELRIMNFDGSLKLAYELRDRGAQNRHSGEYKGLQNLQLEVLEADSKTANLSEMTRLTDILISCSGVPGIIKKDMVKDGVILIDVGAPAGDIEKEAYEKASFVSPVPGGVGPVTILYLVKNLVLSSIPSVLQI